MKRCKDCRYEFGFTLCSVNQQLNKATDLSKGIRGRQLNLEGKCPDYIRKWWKFWRPK